jgi:hypothetical protein
MPLTTLDLFTRIVATFPPFSVVFTDWESMMPAVGSGWRSSLIRTLARNLALSCSQTP